MVSFEVLALLPIVVAFAWPFLQSLWPFDVTELKGQRVIVCGASTGIGEEIAYIYARGGARIVLAARRDAVLQRVQEKCKELGAEQVERLSVDLSTSSAAQKLIDYANEKLGGIDILVLNHVVTFFQPWSEKSDLERAEKLIKINLMSYVYLATHALPYLENSHGTLAVVSSMGAKIPFPCMHIYAASKSALQAFFESLRLDLGLRRSNVTVSLIPLGLFSTDGAKATMAEASHERCLEKIFEQTGGRPADAAMVIVRSAYFKRRETFYPGGSATLFYYIYVLSPSLTENIHYFFFAVDDILKRLF